MTRETKAGLIVSCSFICLVAIVLFSKLREKSALETQPGDDTNLALASDAAASADQAPSPVAADQEKKSDSPLQNVEPAPFKLDNERKNQNPPGTLVNPNKPAPKEAELVPPLATKMPAPEFKIPDLALSSSVSAPKSTKKETPAAAKDSSVPVISPWNDSKQVAAGPNLGSAKTTTPPSAATKSPDPFSTAPSSAKDKVTIPVPEFPIGSPSSATPLPAVKPTTPSAGATNTTTSTPPGALDPNKAGGTGTFILPGIGKAAEKNSKPEPAKPAGDLKSTWQLPDPPPAVTKPSTAAGPTPADKASSTPKANPSFESIQGSGLTGRPGMANNPLPTFAKESQPRMAPTAPGASPGSAVGSGPGFNQQPGTKAATTTVLPPLGAANFDRDGALNAGSPRSPSFPPRGEDPKAKEVRLGTPSATSPGGNQLAQAPANTSPFPSFPERANNRTEQPLNAPLRPAPIPTVIPATPPSSSQTGGIVQVESYDEETYTCRLGDTFRMISQAYYRSERYERALLLFNRNHPLATEAMRQNPPSLREGLPIYIPPARILEKYYANVIGNDFPAAQPPPTSGATQDLRNTPAAEKKYRVRGNGEMFFEIARHVLGTGERWPEIYRLNPRFDPKDPIPAGTELRLPTDAR